jgi:hypothetical protein
MRTLCLFALAGCLWLAVGCGGGEESSTQSTPSKAKLPLAKAIEQSFPKPKPDPEVGGSAKAIKRGEAACKGKTPLEVKRQFISKSDLSAAQRKALKGIKRAEAHPGADFVAGQLAALVYEGTLGKGELAQYGYRGCVYGLAEGVGG